jgi:exopolyphosphatase/guanosine-5'-triphosphate,3'-diphosphate pyrophosphatase
VLAAIDIGSNTVRLLIGDVNPDGALSPLRYVRRVTRLAGGFTDQRGLAPESMERTLSALHEFQDICRQHRVNNLLAVGTAAFRTACNGCSFAEQIRASTRIPVEIITGEEEARLTASGVLLALSETPLNTLIFDIGGGSTEFVHMVDGNVLWTDSLPLGVVRLCEEHKDPKEIEAFVHRLLNRIQRQVESCSTPGGSQPILVGTAGTVTSLAAMDMKMTRYDWQRVNNYHLQKSRLESLALELGGLTPSQRETLPGLEAGRGDLIMPGLQVVLALLDIFQTNQLTVSDFGILEGLAARLAKGPSTSVKGMCRN